MPEVSMQYLIDDLFEVGPVMPGGFGPAVLTHGEIRAWLQNAGMVRQPWEISMLRRLSGEFIKASRDAERPDSLPPFSRDAASEVLANTAASLRAHMRGMAG